MKSELILPAGDLRKAKFAFLYGADACYGGLAKHSLRKAEVNFNYKTLSQAISLAHKNNKKFYVTFNIFAKNKHLPVIKNDLIKISKMKPDAFIAADLGVIRLIKKYTKIPIHVSTQANTSNYEAVKFWSDFGVKRVVLARELNLKEISEIHGKLPSIELEVFVHGAMCVSYSGRCLLSKVMTGREANLGNCAQPCRWNYKVYLEEELRPGQYFSAEQDRDGTYIFNSKDLNLIEYLPKLKKAGVLGFKVEGRNKSEYYLSTIARAYKKAMEAEDSKKFKKEISELKEETEKVAHREYSSGFILEEAKKGETYQKRSPIESYSFLAVLETKNKEGYLIEPRNQIKVGDKVEIMTPDKVYQDKVLSLNDDSVKVKIVNPKPQKRKVYLKLKNNNYPSCSILRKRIK